jgi:hypothetical protein
MANFKRTIYQFLENDRVIFGGLLPAGEKFISGGTVWQWCWPVSPDDLEFLCLRLPLPVVVFSGFSPY